MVDQTWQIRDTMAVGGLATTPTATMTIAPLHTNPIFLIAGELDNFNCGDGVNSSNCGGTGGYLDQV